MSKKTVDREKGGISGVLLEDARDTEAYAGALAGLIADGERAAAIGQAAKERVRDRYLGVRHLMQYAELLERAGAW